MCVVINIIPTRCYFTNAYYIHIHPILRANSAVYFGRSIVFLLNYCAVNSRENFTRTSERTLSMPQTEENETRSTRTHKNGEHYAHICNCSLLVSSQHMHPNSHQRTLLGCILESIWIIPAFFFEIARSRISRIYLSGIYLFRIQLGEAAFGIRT